MKLLVLMVSFVAALAAGPENDVFNLNVALVQTLRDHRGVLHLGHDGISFRSNDGKVQVAAAWAEVRSADVADRRKLRFSLYDVRKWLPLDPREYVFRASPDAPVEEIARMLTTRVLRPVVGHYEAASQFSTPAFHRRMRRGTSGTLEIGTDAIRYVSDQTADSRTWLYRDIETIGRPDSFRFRVTTNRETYVLEMKDVLPEAAFQLAWDQVYRAGAIDR